MLTGHQGVKYGLSVPKKATKAAPKKTLAAFAEDDSEDEQQKVADAIQRQALSKQSDHKANTSFPTSPQTCSLPQSCYSVPLCEYCKVLYRTYVTIGSVRLTLTFHQILIILCLSFSASKIQVFVDHLTNVAALKSDLACSKPDKRFLQAVCICFGL